MVSTAQSSGFTSHVSPTSPNGHVQFLAMAEHRRSAVGLQSLSSRPGHDVHWRQMRSAVALQSPQNQPTNTTVHPASQAEASTAPRCLRGRLQLKEAGLAGRREGFALRRPCAGAEAGPGILPISAAEARRARAIAEGKEVRLAAGGERGTEGIARRTALLGGVAKASPALQALTHPTAQPPQPPCRLGGVSGARRVFLCTAEVRHNKEAST